MPRLVDPDPSLPSVVTAAAALAAGLTRDQIRHRLRAGRWISLGRGVYRRADWQPDGVTDPYARARIEHVHRVIAAMHANAGCVVGFESAAVLHGLPLFSALPQHVTLIAPAGHWRGRRSGLLLRQPALSAADVESAPLPVTTVARTWFDVARTRPLSDGLSVGDAGLRSGSLTMNDVLGVLARAGSIRGCRRAALAAGHLDGLRETALESGSWAYFVRHRLPLPRMQVEVRDERGHLIGRVDFLWEGRRLVGECDGRLKYGTLEAHYKEKRREDDIRARGYGVARWGWEDLRDERLAQRLRRQL